MGGEEEVGEEGSNEGRVETDHHTVTEAMDCDPTIAYFGVEGQTPVPCRYMPITSVLKLTTASSHCLLSISTPDADENSRPSPPLLGEPTQIYTSDEQHTGQHPHM